MNLLVKPFGLIALSALFFASCKKENNNISLKNNTPVGVFFDTLELETTQIFDPGSVQTSTDGNFFNPYLMIGSYYDPTFGVVTAEGYASIFKATEEKILNSTSDTIFEHFNGEINFKLDKYYVGEKGTKIGFNVYQLTDAIEKKSYYASSPKINYDESSLLGSFDLGGDSIVSIPLESWFAEKVFGLIIESEKSEDSLYFEKNIKGLAIVPKTIASGPKEGAIYYINLLANETRVKIHYRHKGNTEKFTFELGMGGNNEKFYRIISDRSKLEAPLNKLTNVGDNYLLSENGNKGYIQSSTGVRTKIKIKDFETFRGKFNKAIINRAEIILNTETNDTTIPYISRPPLDILEKDNSGKFHSNSVILGPHPKGVAVNNNSYMINVTSYIQNLIEGKPVQDLVISPKEDLNTFTLNRVVLYEGDKNNPQPFKIRVFYTKLD